MREIWPKPPKDTSVVRTLVRCNGCGREKMTGIISLGQPECWCDGWNIFTGITIIGSYSKKEQRWIEAQCVRDW